jgi:hypothetical protein
MTQPDLRHRMRRSDRIASILIVALLCGIGATVYLVGRRAPVEVIPLQNAADSPPISQFAAPKELLGRFVLTDSKPYNAENLYEYIDGEAPRYIQFGFKSLVVAEYEPREKGDSLTMITADLYDMGNRRNAFGIFHDSRPMEDEDIPVGNTGSGSGDFVSFWKGGYYVRVKVILESPDGEDSGKLVRSAAQEIAATINDPVGTLLEFTLFPKEGLDEETLSFEKDSALGLSYLHDVFVGYYDRNGESYRLFFSRMDTDHAAKDVVDGQLAFLRSNGKVESDETMPERSEVWGREKYMGPMLFVGEGNIIAGSIGISDLEQARAAVQELLDQVKRTPAEELEG